jgi:hypothetical protein
MKRHIPMAPFINYKKNITFSEGFVDIIHGTCIVVSEAWVVVYKQIYACVLIL